MRKRVRLTAAPGALSALGCAGSDSTDRGAEKVTLSGDLGQMGTMGSRLRAAGFDVRNSDVYPVLQGADIEPGLRYLWENRVDGWWNQRHLFLKNEICTAEEYADALAAQVGR